MPIGTSICYLLNRSSQIHCTENDLINLLSAYGPIKSTKTLQHQPAFIVLIEFAHIKSALLAKETLNQTLSHLGILTVSMLPPSIYSHTPFKLGSHQTSPLLNNDAKSYPYLGNGVCFQNISNIDSENCQYQFNYPLSQPTTLSDQSKNENEPTKYFKIPNYPRSVTPSPIDSSPSHPTVIEFLETLKESVLLQRKLSPVPKDCFIYLLINNLNTKELKLNHILNLLGSFSNITNYLIDRKSDTAVFGFTNESKIDFIVNVLHNQLFFGKTLTAKRVIHLLDLSIFHNFASERFIIGAENKKNFRYQQGLVIKFNPPSKIVHLTSISSKLSQNNLFDILGKFHTPTKIAKLKQRSSSASEMYLVEFDQLFKSLEILSIFHNTLVAEKSMKVSFSHTRLDQNC